MVTLIHGTDTEKSRQELMRLKSDVTESELRIITGKHDDMSDILTAFESHSLFETQTTIIIEEFFTLHAKKLSLSKEFLKVLQTHTDGNIIVWESKEVSKTILAKIQEFGTVKTFSFPKTLFLCLDAVKPKNAAIVLKLVGETLMLEPAELFWYLLGMRIRQLIIAQGTEKPESIQTWQWTRLTNQSRSFTMKQLLILHESYYQEEYRMKSGSVPWDMKQCIERLCIMLNSL